MANQITAVYQLFLSDVKIKDADLLSKSDPLVIIEEQQAGRW